MAAKKIILDTDIGPDCDDAGALALINLLADRGLCEILGIGHCTSNPYGAGTIDAINRYYGRPDVEIGTYYGRAFLEDAHCMTYNKYIATHFPNRYRKKQAQEVVKMYRRILAGQDDKSVECICIGPMNNLSALLDSEPDEYSPMGGTALVNKKVSRLTAMGGIFRCSSENVNAWIEKDHNRSIEDITEWNVGCDIPAAQNVAENWPTSKTYVGLEAGLIITGRRFQSSVPENHPVRVAYKLFGSEVGRFSWDLVTVEYAIGDNRKHYRTSVPGRVRFDEKGRTVWIPGESGTDCFVELAQTAGQIEKDLDALLVMPPQGGFPA